MPRPTLSDVHVNRPLTNISVAYLQDQKNFVAGLIFPNIPVQNQSDRYFTYDKGDFFRDEMKIRALSTESAGSGYAIDSTPTYSCQRWALHKDVDDTIRANSDAPLNVDREATEFLTLKALIRKEKLWVSNFFKNSIWGTSISGVASSPSSSQALYWNLADATPVEDVRKGKAKILSATGFEPNCLVLGYETMNALLDNPEIVDRIKYQGTSDRPAAVNEQTLAALFGLDRVVVMKSVENTAAQGQTATVAFIGGKHALLCYAAPSASLMAPSAGYTFSWNGYLGASAFGSRIKSFRMENLGSDRVEVEMAMDMKMIASDLGYFFNSIVQ